MIMVQSSVVCTVKARQGATLGFAGRAFARQSVSCLANDTQEEIAMPPPLDLVFGGGGTRGVALAGALEVLEQRRPTVRRVIGTSSGAIAAVFGAAGISSREYLKLVPAK